MFALHHGDVKCCVWALIDVCSMRLAATGSFRVEWRAILLLSNLVGVGFIATPVSG